MTAFATAAAVIVVLAFAAAMVVAAAQERVAGGLAAAGPAMKRWGGWVLVLVGAWFVALGVFAGPFARVFPV